MHPLTPSWYQPRPDLKRIDNISEIIGIETNNIKVIENWISDEDIKISMDIINRYTVNNSATHSYPIHTVGNYVPDKKDLDFQEYMGNKMVEEGQKQYNQPLTKDQRFLYVVHPTGTYIDPHTDILDIDNPDYENDTYEKQIKEFPFLWSGHLSILAYLNDEYDGGELYFPEHNFGVRPKKGMLILFPGNLHYVHGVAPITSGTRYTLSQWCKFTNFKQK